MKIPLVTKWIDRLNDVVDSWCVEAGAPAQNSKTGSRAKLHCVDCNRPIHRNDRRKIITARHVNCSDPKLVGQKSIEVSEIDPGYGE